MYGPGHYRLCRTVPRHDARRLSRHDESRDALEGRGHHGRVFASGDGRHQGTVAQSGSTEMNPAENNSANATRRTFLKVASAGIALNSTAASYAKVLGANDRIRVGLCGFSERFRDALLPAFHQHSTELNFEFAGLSDIWKLRR